MGSARPSTSFFGHYIISTHVFNCEVSKAVLKGDVHIQWCIPAFLISISGSCRAHLKDGMRHSGKRVARKCSADECVAPPARTQEDYPLHSKRTSTASTETSATKTGKAIVVITPVPHRAVATLQASVLELWL
jgi:hypothetical protein